MKKYTIELNDDLSAIYEDIAEYNQKSAEEAMQIMLGKVIETMLGKNPKNPYTNCQNPQEGA